MNNYTRVKREATNFDPHNGRKESDEANKRFYRAGKITY